MTINNIIEFFERLQGKEGCSFRSKGKNIQWDCKAERDKRKAKKILKSMKISVDEQNKFLKLLEKNGGFCDCEIIFNAMDNIYNLPITFRNGTKK